MDLYAAQFVGEMVATIGLKFLTVFHRAAFRVITPSPSFGRVLINLGCVDEDKCRPILNGCNTQSFSPDGPKDPAMADLQHPIWLYVGRVSHEKNVLAFLSLRDKLPGSIAVVGQGPYFEEAVQKFSSDRCKFLGWRKGEELTAAYRGADFFVFPSKTDTFGQVIIEAMASGLPVAAHPVTGPIDLVVEGTGAVDDDLLVACNKAMKVTNKSDCVAHAKKFSWSRMADEFLLVHAEQRADRR